MFPQKKFFVIRPGSGGVPVQQSDKAGPGGDAASDVPLLQDPQAEPGQGQPAGPTGPPRRRLQPAQVGGGG